ncbi:hypothetical protein MRX96_058487 [Rhipicephalus microplus]
MIFLILLGFWNKVLVRIDRVQKRLQDPKMNFHDAALDMKALRDHFHEERETLDTDLKFGFLLDINKLCYSEDKNELKTNCNTFGNFYSSDVNAQDLYEEILDCRLLLSRRIDQTVSRPEELLKFIVEYGDDGVFPNLRVALQMMLTIGVSIAGCERLTDLALLSVEREETEKTNFDVIIEQFASSKARKVQL